MSAKVKAVLIKARELIEQGWTRDRMVAKKATGQVCYCALGAIWQAELGLRRQGVVTKDDRMVEQAKTVLTMHLPGGWREIGAFNDSWGTKQEHVVAAFRAAEASL